MHLCFLADQPHHITTCARWEHLEWGKISGKSLDEAMISYTDSRHDRLPLTLLACSSQDILAGMISLWPSDCPARPDLSPWLASLYVAPDHRGQGIGTLLFGCIQTEARRLGLGRLYLMTQHSEAVYAAQGWHSFERLDGPGAMNNAVLMFRDP